MQDLFLIGSLPWWVIVLVACGSVALLIQQFLSLKQRLSLGQSSFLVFLRACVYGLLIFFLFGPALVEKRVAKLRRPLTILVDSSQSMAFPASAKPAPDGQPAKSRLELVRDTLLAGKEPLIQELSRDYDLHLYRFGTALEPIAPAFISQLKAQDQGTRLLEVLQSAAREAGEQSGILLFSDGIANGDRKTLEGTQSLPVPVFTIGVGDTEGFTDVRIADLRAPEFAFRGREVKLDLTVQAYGLKGKTFPLYFNRGKNLITSRSISVNADPFEQKITFSFTPKKDFKIDVQRDKIRVLTLSGSPAWNYRFLRMALKQDPLIELVSFVFLRTPTDSVDVPENQLSLIPFPIDDIF
jgi:hypothetical protein